MKQKSSDTLILELAKHLSGNLVDTKAVNEALEQICLGFSFECGLIYEVDRMNQYTLAEHFILGELPLLTCISAEMFKPEYYNSLAKKTVTYINKNDNNTEWESGLLTIFSAHSIAVIAVIDDKSSTLGFIVFLNTKTRDLVDETELEIISISLSMLVKYVGIRMYQNRLSLAQTTLENILDNTGIDIYVNDFYNRDVLYVNKSMAEPYGGQAQFLGRKCWQVLYPGQPGPCDFCPQKELVDGNGEPSAVYTWDYQRPFDGAWFRVFSAAFRWMDGRLAHVVSSANITDNKKKEALIEYMANYDSLTNLPNRRMLINECKRRIDLATENEKGYLIFFDIDGFKLINDRFGHDSGDEFLIQLGEFFSEIPLLKDAIYRNGGDEFVAIIGGECITKENIRVLASFIHARFKEPWKLKNGKVYSNTSIGVACFPEDGRTEGELLRKADLAMYQVKKSGGGGICFGYELKEDPFV